MINATSQSVEGALSARARPQLIGRIGVRTFWTMLLVETLLLVSVLFWLLGGFNPTATPIAATGDISYVREAVWSRLGGTVNDPLIEVEPGITVRESNLRGFRLDDVVYYYYVIGNQNFDPLSRGVVEQSEIEVVLHDDAGPVPVVIYRILPE